MSLREAEVARSRRAQRSHQKQTERKQRKQQFTPLPAILNDNQVLRFSEWCSLNGISQRTGRRLFASGDGPVLTQLSPKRVGITVRANREWQASRARV
jgi:hypothetical protein